MTRSDSEHYSTILIVDDNPAALYAKSRLLFLQNYRVLEATNGLDALTTAKTSLPDLIVLDVNLPDISGFDVCQQLKTKPETQLIKVLQTSAARIGAPDRVKSLEVGADAYLVEPAEEEELIGTVRALLKLGQHERENRRLIERLTESETRYRSLIERMPAAMYTIDREGRITFYNDQAAELWGRRPKLGDEGMKFCGSHKLFLPDGTALPHNKTSMVDALLDGTSWHGQEVIIERLDGSRRHVVVHIDPLHDTEGQVVGAVNLFTDITERKRAEEALRENHRFITEMTSVLPGVLYIFDLQEQRNVYVNRHTGTVLGYSPEEIHAFGDEFISTMVHHDDAPRVHQHFDDMKGLADGATAQLEYRFRHRDGSYRWFLSRDVVWQRNAEGAVQQILGVATDITERKQAEAALRESEERLQHWNMELGQAVNVQTAELQQSRDRLRAMAMELNISEQRERKRIAAELHDHLQQILVLGKLTIGQGKQAAVAVPACREALKKVDDILSDALTYTRTLVADLSPSVLRDHGLAAALQWLGTSMHKHNLRVTVVVPEDRELKLPDDQVIPLFQSVRELLINISKHAGTKHAVVRMELRDEQLRITVRDEGDGFDLAAAAAAAAADCSSTGSLSSKFGLFSIRERMLASGGFLDLHSARGQGTTATLTLPLRNNVRGKGVGVGRGERSVVEKGTVGANSGLASGLTSDASRVVRVLLVDDHVMVRQGLRSVLDAYEDIQMVGEARNGEEAVQLVDQLRPAVVVMDINMPKMNGIEATGRIKRRYPDTIVIGLSVNAALENQEAMRRAGALSFITKEAAVEQLHDVIQDAVRKVSVGS